MPSVLKVNELQNTGGDSALTIDDDGRISISKPIILVAYMSVTMSSTGIIVWNNAPIDTASAYSTSTGQFTCPKAGYYEVTYHYLLRSNTLGHRTNVRKNNTKQNTASGSGATLVWHKNANTTAEDNVGASTIVECAVNDTLDVHLAYLGNGDIYGGGNVHNQLTIKYLG